MLLFQNFGLYPRYRTHFAELARGASTFVQRINVLLEDRFGASHLLLPVDEGHPDAFFTCGDDPTLQSMWAAERGMPRESTLEQILLAQIEHHRTEVFYNHDPMRYGSAFVRKLPGCVKRSIAWRAAPSRGADFAAYDLVVCNFPSILKSYEDAGWSSAYFAPSHDPQMNAYSGNANRPIDVLFVGSYTRHHRKRAAMLELLAAHRSNIRIAFYLDKSRTTRFAESPLGRLLPLAEHRRPHDIRAVSHDPVFGRNLYEVLGQAKIVMNGAIDMAGQDRGNMRCFEALGCGSLLLSDAGLYPDGMEDGRTLVTYESAPDLLARVPELLANEDYRTRIAHAGTEMVADRYSRARQWARFNELAN